MSAPPILNEQTRLVHISAALSVSPRNIPLVGVPTVHNLQFCNMSHKETSVCRFCRWNGCQGCGLIYGQGFSGWTGLCPACSAHSSFTLPVIPDSWKEFYTAPAQPAAAGGGAVVVILDDDDEPSERDRLKKELPLMPDTWEVPASGDVREYATFTLYDTAVSVAVNPKYAVEIQEVVGRLVQAREKCSQTRDPIPGSFASVLPPPFCTIEQLIRIQSYLQLRMYKTAVEEATAKNMRRAQSDRASVMEDTAFHGTNLNAALSVAKNGPLGTRCVTGAYGKGFYTSLGSIAIPLLYAIKNSTQHQDKLALVMGSCIVGKNSYTTSHQDIPSPGCDTGGCGNHWIHTIFDKNHFNSEHIIVLKLSTETEWNEQVKHFDKAYDLAMGVASPVPAIVIPSSPPTSPPAAGGGGGLSTQVVAKKAAKKQWHKKQRVADKKKPDAPPVPGSRYKPTPPTSDDSSSDDQNDKTYKPGARPGK